MRHKNEPQSGLLPEHIEASILAEIRDAVVNIEYGSITLIVQDARLIQMDVIKKVRFIGAAGKPSTPSAARTERDAVKGSFGQQIAPALKGMKFGQVTLVVKEGRIVQVERMEKQRFPNVEGMFGEGI